MAGKLKNLVFFAALLIFLQSVTATVFMHSPAETRIVPGTVLELGAVSPGQTFSLSIERKSEKQTPWNALSVLPDTLPTGWTTNLDVLDETMLMNITVPETEPIGSKTLSFTALNQGIPGFGDTFSGTVTVLNPESVFSAGIDVPRAQTEVNVPLPVKISVSNNTIAPAHFILSSNLPGGWVQEQRVILVPPQSSTDVTLFILPLVYGKRQGVLFVQSAENNFSKSFTIDLNVFPTLGSKFQAGWLGIPFFSLTLWPSYLLNGILSLFV